MTQHFDFLSNLLETINFIYNRYRNSEFLSYSVPAAAIFNMWLPFEISLFLAEVDFDKSVR